MEFSARMKQFDVGIFSLLAQMKKEQLAQGRQVIDLSIGAPNIAPAQHIIDALRESAANPANYVYAISDTQELQEAVATWYRRRYGVTIDPQTELVSLLGSQEGLSHIAMTIINDGDTVLVPDPCYPVFGQGPALAGAQLYYMPQRPENGYIIDLDEIPQDVAKRAKFMIVSYPNNPTTVMAPDSFYEAVIAFAKRYDIIVLHDNAYSELVFDGKSCGSFLQFPGAKEIGVEFNSLSKTYGLAGARIGFCIGNAQVVEKVKALKSNIDYGMFLPLQKAAIAAITGDQTCVATTRDSYQTRRDILVEGFDRAGWHMKKSEATMFVWAKLPEGYHDSQAFAKLLLERAGIMGTPGSAFGPSGEGHMRFALTQDAPNLKIAVEAFVQSGIIAGK